MKRNLIIVLVVCSCMNVSAQYKKASFLNKPGRTHEIGFTGHFISDGGVTVPGIAYSYGREREGKRLFHWFDLEFLLPAKFSYNTVEFTSRTPVKVSGESSFGLNYRYNLAYYLIDNSKAENKILPFVTGGIHIKIFGGSPKEESTTFSPNVSNDVDRQVTYDNVNFGANVGVGGIYKISSGIGIKLTGGYSFEYNSESGQADSWKANGYSVYKFYYNHPYVTLGVRFIVDKD
jgi:hypothetical protein